MSIGRNVVYSGADTVHIHFEDLGFDHPTLGRHSLDQRSCETQSVWLSGCQLVDVHQLIACAHLKRFHTGHPPEKVPIVFLDGCIRVTGQPQR